MAAVETLQHPWELEQLLRLYRSRPKGRTLEIGAHKGGTLYHWLQHADAVIVVDDVMDGLDLWTGWATEADTHLFWHWGKSQDENILRRAQATGPYDFIFIDGDHAYDAVKADWDNYTPMVAPGGIVALHDIRYAPQRGHGVYQLWQEIKQTTGACTLEISEWLDDWGSIGVWFAL